MTELRTAHTADPGAGEKAVTGGLTCDFRPASGW
jgi:hypothetical protein